MSWATELQSINKHPNFPFVEKLRERYGIEVPEGAPKYQTEYLYKYCRQAESTDIPEPIVDYAAKKAKELWDRFPWLKLKYDLVSIEKKLRPGVYWPTFKDMPDGTIKYCEGRKKYVMYLGGRLRVSSTSLDKLKASSIKKHKFSSFIE